MWRTQRQIRRSAATGLADSIIERAHRSRFALGEVNTPKKRERLRPRGTQFVAGTSPHSLRRLHHSGQGQAY